MAEEMSLVDIYQNALSSDYVVVDCEASSLDNLHNDLWLIGIGSKDWCCVLSKKELTPLFWEMFNDIFRQKKMVGHNIKFDLHILHRFGLKLETIEAADIEDTMLQSQLIDENGRHDLQSLFFQYYKQGREEPRMKDMMKDFVDGKAEPLINHCLRDIMDTAILWPDLQSEIERLGLVVAFTVEKKLLKVLWNMEKHGVLLDHNYLEEYNGLLDLDLANIQREFPDGINLVSPKQVGEYLYGTLGIEPKMKTPTGLNSTSDDAFKLLKSPVADKILYYRTLSHTK